MTDFEKELDLSSLDKIIEDQDKFDQLITAVKALRNDEFIDVLKGNSRAMALFVEKLRQVATPKVEVDLKSFTDQAKLIVENQIKIIELLSIKPSKIYFKRDAATYLDHMEIEYASITSKVNQNGR